MKKLIIIATILMLALPLSAQNWNKNLEVEASELNLVGKAFYDTPNPYHRIDTCRFKGFTKWENMQCRYAAGLAVLFTTDAEAIGVKMDFDNADWDSYRSYRGFDLYIKKDGKWLWAGMKDFPGNHKNKESIHRIVKDMAPGEKECLRPFIDRMVKAHPGKPIIVQRTIYWEMENFDTSAQKEFEGRRALSDSLMREICKEYKDVYYIKPDAALHNGESSTADGVHPNDHGYSLWEESIEKPILKILKKYYKDI